MSDKGDKNMRALQAQKLEALGQFAGGIAHDFNNILSIIEGYAGIAEKDLAAGRLSSDLLKKIMAAAQRGAGLTRQLLAFSRQKVGVDERLDLVRELREMQVMLKPLLGAAVMLNMSLHDAPVWIWACRDHLTQIVLNLALNARDAMPQGGVLSIACAPHRLTVADNGAGIADDILPRIFDPFFSTKALGRGTGLGLSVVHGIAEQMGARIAVATMRGQGTRFDIDFSPADSIDIPVAVQQRAGLPSLKDRTILLAEDEPELRDVLGIIFAGMEMKVLEASNANQALDLQRRHAGGIDFLLTDIVMPGMDGVALAQQFRAERSETNIIYMSGYPAVAVPPGADFIQKPLSADMVRAVLQRALERRDERLLNGDAQDDDLQ